MGAKVRASFIGSARTYGARRVWHDVLAEGIACGLHKIERLRREVQKLKAERDILKKAAAYFARDAM